MDWRSITVSAEVDIYLKDIKDEVLEMLDNDELIMELKKRDVDYKETSEKYPCSTNSTPHQAIFIATFATS